jgi:hypothetical protein
LWSVASGNQTVSGGGGRGYNYRSQEVASKNLRKDFIEIMKLLFVQFWHLWFWRFLKINLFLA